MCKCIQYANVYVYVSPPVEVTPHTLLGGREHETRDHIYIYIYVYIYMYIYIYYLLSYFDECQIGYVQRCGIPRGNVEYGDGSKMFKHMNGINV